ncbi:unnamed protein product [Thelazia callipaeda]|uniref:DUF4201 domain-containing protein n=1 Tax=Thelazia callipaeda TaxID=103827 RepID=A0A0N5D052_THECL|nr:unnamed protein product [Thelazia callipaeda]
MHQCLSGIELIISTLCGNQSTGTPSNMVHWGIHMTTKMPIVAQRSKFSCLKIYDDSTSSSDENGDRLKKNSSSNKIKKCGDQAVAGRSGLVVHPVPQRPKKRGKKKKKDCEQAAQNIQEFTHCLRESLPSNADVENSNSTEDKSEQPKSAIEMLVSELDSKATDLLTKNDGPQKVVRARYNFFRENLTLYPKELQLVALYRLKLLEMHQNLVAETQARLQTEAELIKYKSRYKKLCELLKDAEVNEKTHMAAELEKARVVESELSTEIGELRGELMQAQSKIRSLEMKRK